MLDDGSNSALYQIEYEDNDSEDLCCIELESILIPLLPPAQETIAVAKIRAKRVAAINEAVTQPSPKKGKRTRKKRTQRHFAVPQGKNVFFYLIVRLREAVETMTVR